MAKKEAFQAMEIERGDPEKKKASPVTWVVLGVVLLLSSGVYWLFLKPLPAKTDVVSQAVAAFHAQHPNAKIDLTEVYPGDWTRVVVATPYRPVEDYDLGFREKRTLNKIGIAMHDSMCVLVFDFPRGRSQVHIEDRNAVDFSLLKEHEYARSEATAFTINKRGTNWLQLVD